ncbi:MAG: hypothetical protein AB7P76_01485 [Candidatus Melainabacteria bacterium]
MTPAVVFGMAVAEEKERIWALMRRQQFPEQQRKKPWLPQNWRDIHAIPVRVPRDTFERMRRFGPQAFEGRPVTRALVTPQPGEAEYEFWAMLHRDPEAQQFHRLHFLRYTSHSGSPWTPEREQEYCRLKLHLLERVVRVEGMRNGRTRARFQRRWVG